jgi:hypothetical protein
VTILHISNLQAQEAVAPLRLPLQINFTYIRNLEENVLAVAPRKNPDSTCAKTLLCRTIWRKCSKLELGWCLVQIPARIAMLMVFISPPRQIL